MRDSARQFWNRIEKRASGCWEWTGCIGNHGYGIINLGVQKPTLCHRLMAMITFGDIPKHISVMHSCDNRKCLNPNHLSLGSHHDNMKDAAIKNRKVKKTSNENVLKLRELYKSGVKQMHLAEMFSISRSSVCMIISGKQRQHI